MSAQSFGRKVLVLMQALVLSLGFGVGSLAVAGVGAGTAMAACTDDLTIQNGADCAKPTSAKENLFAPDGIFMTIANTLIFLVGAVAVVYLIIGGLRYVISNGDSKNIEAAKNTILYAIIGIVVAVISFALVQFVIGALNKAT